MLRFKNIYLKKSTSDIVRPRQVSYALLPGVGASPPTHTRQSTKTFTYPRLSSSLSFFGELFSIIKMYGTVRQFRKQWEGVF